MASESLVSSIGCCWLRLKDAFSWSELLLNVRVDRIDLRHLHKVLIVHVKLCRWRLENLLSLGILRLHEVHLVHIRFWCCNLLLLFLVIIVLVFILKVVFILSPHFLEVSLMGHLCFSWLISVIAVSLSCLRLRPLSNYLLVIYQIAW